MKILSMSDVPTGMSYIGFAYNKETMTESSVPTDYTWTKFVGEDGKPGTDGVKGDPGKDGRPFIYIVKLFIIEHIQMGQMHLLLGLVLLAGQPQQVSIRLIFPLSMMLTVRLINFWLFSQSSGMINQRWRLSLIIYQVLMMIILI